MGRSIDRRQPRLALTAILSLSLSAVSGSASAQANSDGEVLTPGDFALGREIVLQSGGSIQQVPLDLRVYRGSVEPRLADLRVFDGAGEPVPHALHSPPHPQPQASANVSVPFFALPAPSAGEREDGLSLSNPGAYGIDAELSASGAVLRLRPTAALEKTTGESEVKGYLIDASQLEKPVVGVELELGPSSADFIVPLKVEASDNLADFREVASKAVVARLTQDQHRIEQSSVELPATRREYFRITWPNQELPATVGAVRLQLAREAAPRPFRRDRIPGQPMPDEPHAFLFDLGGMPPVSRVQIDLKAANSLVEAQLYSGTTPEGPWTRHFDGLLYQLGSNGVLRNPEIRCGKKRRPYFKLVVSPKGGGVGTQTPTLEIAWIPDQVLFVAGGRGPYSLAYGRAGARNASFDAAELLSIRDAGEPPRAPEQANLGPERSVAGSRVLTLPDPPLPVRTVALWGILILSVAVVVAMSVRLLREMS